MISCACCSVKPWVALLCRLFSEKAPRRDAENTQKGASRKTVQSMGLSEAIPVIGWPPSRIGTQGGTTMLVLTRRIGEEMVIGDNSRIKVAFVQGE